jgi:hypothetical protein
LKQLNGENVSNNDIRAKIQSLVPLASNVTEYGLAGLLASNALNKYNGDNYVHPIIYPYSNNSARLSSTSPKKRRTVVKMKSKEIKAELINEIVYPNPADDIITLNLVNLSANLELVKVTDLTGRVLIEQKTYGLSNLKINVNNLVNGNYFIVTYSKGADKIQSIKLAIQHK